jgi:hypothetical protein
MHFFGDASQLLETAGGSETLDAGSKGSGQMNLEPSQLKSSVKTFAEALARHRQFERETDPPLA